MHSFEANHELPIVIEGSATTHIYQEEIYRIAPATTIVLPCPWVEVSEEHRQPLEKILHALRLSLESVRIVHQTAIDLSAFAEKPARMIIFHTPPKPLALHEVHAIGETQVIFAGGLDVFTQDEATKRKFWSALKMLFPS